MSGDNVRTDITVSDYGKNYVKLLYVKKGQSKHFVKVWCDVKNLLVLDLFTWNSVVTIHYISHVIVTLPTSSISFNEGVQRALSLDIWPAPNTGSVIGYSCV